MNKEKSKKIKSKTTKNKLLVLLDVHAILHRAYHALPDFETSKGEPTGALYGLCTMIIKINKELNPDYMVACYDLPEPTYRHEIYNEYKALRPKTDERLVQQLEKSKTIFEAMNIPMYSSVGFEADDMLGTIVKSLKNDKKVNIVIASGDMDTMQLVEGDRVRVYTLKKGIKDTIIYNEEAVIQRWGFSPKYLTDYKGLRGDPSDNIIGVPGIGEKTAEELIQNFGSIEDIYKEIKNPRSNIKEKVKPRIIKLLEENEEEALFSKMLATIREDAPIYFNLPKEDWRNSIVIKKVEALFKEFEFKSLSQKLAESLNIDMPISKIDTAFDQNEIKEINLMLWVIDSNKTNPNIEDVLNFTNEDDIKNAKDVLERKIKEDNLGFIFNEIEKPLISIVCEMKDNGVKIDLGRLNELSKKYHKELSSLEKKIWGIVGEEFNIASPKQLGEMLFVKMGLKTKNQKRNASGGFSTKESELEKLKDEHPIAQLILDYRELAKLLSTYIDTIPTQVDQNARLHADLLQSGTTTGRMSSQNPNIQNIPNRTELGREIRKSFISEKGFKLVSFDYSQIELRIAAFLSGDQKLIEIFKTNKDVHTAVASEVFGVSLDKVTKEMRNKAKVINFGVMYGMGVLALRQNIGCSKEDAQKFLDDYFLKFSGLAKYLDRVKRETSQRGFTETFFGRRRYFPDINSRLPFMKSQAERMAINAPIQGTEADIIKLAMIKINNFLKTKDLKNDVKLLLQVHDELVFEIKENIVSSVSEEIKSIMESVIDPKKTEGVICITNISAGDNWGELQSI